MIEHLINLEYLDIAQNRFFSFPEKLSNGLLKLNNLSILKLEYNTIEKDSLELFLEKLKNKPIEFLDITDNILSVKGCKYLGELFNSWNLKELRMGDCLARNEGIIEFLKYANKINFCEKYKIKQINISGNFYDDDEPITNACDKYGGQVILEEDDESIEGFSGLETITEMVKNL
ncbi:ran specific gtpase-activating protein [Vairimorpha apis BRL 01]|uniref:Ran specific gtpase-activating protein n=1 Tax=Vairimorpha apis BRL 01 TaxID=1037528 RepID=T0LD50_9MICR|nr:ran specific gtpase-activating protein [Vairimorpha apis BRL 01]